MKIDENIELTIESIGLEGVSIARHDNLVYLIKGGLPGENVRIKVTGKKKRFVKATAIEIINPSNDRIEPECEHFGVCGGCSWQNMIYEKQAAWKKEHVDESFKRIGKIKIADCYDTLKAPRVFEYRNKMEFSFGSSRWLTEKEIDAGGDISDKHFALGLHIPERYDKVLNINKCLIQPDYGNEILNAAKEKALELEVEAYNSVMKTGFLRNLIIRSNRAGEFMVILLTRIPINEKDSQYLKWFETEFPINFEKVVSFIHAIHDGITPIAVGEPVKIIGKDCIYEEILGIRYRISPFSFFQTNSWQLDEFIGKILDYADIKPNDIIWDLYCGAGAITLPAAKRCKLILGFELSESSISDAEYNKRENGISNAEFWGYDLHSKKASDFLLSFPKPDTIIIDPPRAGIHPQLVDTLIQISPKKIVYVSCNPATQARDCEMLSKSFRIEKVQPVDMFPHTYHVESIALLENYE